MTCYLGSRLYFRRDKKLGLFFVDSYPETVYDFD
jgi:hypothetical protein